MIVEAKNHMFSLHIEGS